MPGPHRGGILADVNVVEFAQNVAVPYCGRMLASMGADVVKVEPPGGDAMRALARLAPDEGKAYAVINPGKRSMVLDLQDDATRPTVDSLLEWADIALLSFKRPDLERYGLSWDRAHRINPRLVYLATSGFGPAGPDADLGGFDVLAQARSGLGFAMNRAEDGMATTTRPAVVDVATGITSAVGVLAALRHRDRTGHGQRVETSLLGTAMALGTPMLNHFAEFDEPFISEVCNDIDALRLAGVSFADQRRVFEERVSPAAGLFRLYFRHYATSDSMVSVAGTSASLFTRFHQATGVPVPNPDSLEHCVATAETIFRERSTTDWLETLRAAGYPASPYLHPYEALADEQVRANDYVVDVDHPTFGRYTMTGNPIHFSATPTIDTSPSPSLGADTRDIQTNLRHSSRTDKQPR